MIIVIIIVCNNKINPKVKGLLEFKNKIFKNIVKKIL